MMNLSRIVPYKSAFFLALLSFFPLMLNAEQFVFKHRAGDKFRTISTSTEEVLLNGRLQYRTRILNRMASTVIGLRDGVATHEALFQLAEQRQTGMGANESYQWTEEYDSVFGRDARGAITVDRRYAMPTVRNLPLFPDRDIPPGGEWDADGYEAHDLGPVFGLDELYRLPFTAHYQYLGEKEWRGKTYKAIEASYGAEDRPRQFLEDAPRSGVADMPRPVRVSVESRQIIYWDSDLGQPAGAEEEFSLQFEMADGDVYEFRGKAEGETLESTAMDRESMADELEKELADLGMTDAHVTIVDEGVTINLEDIQFEPDSAVFLPGEEEKLDIIGAILQKYSSRDIMVSGHAARVGGSEKSRQQLSEERAAAVASYLIEHGVRTQERVMVRGFGSQRPVADNITETGKQKNRRVEITILEN
jgi:outer membrane protein OmpA-like peptidoglycan-associated protein